MVEKKRVLKKLKRKVVRRANGFEDAIRRYYEEEPGVAALIALKVDTKKAEAIATTVAKYKCIEAVYLVTGDVDIIAKSVFTTYKGLKDFIIGTLGNIDGVKETKTMMIITTFKE
jgi:DNA-binding Lrp family transcriptional regulator